MMGLTVYSQLLMYLPRDILIDKTKKYQGDRYNTDFSTKTHLTVLLAAQMRGWKSLCEIETGCLENYFLMI